MSTGIMATKHVRLLAGASLTYLCSIYIVLTVCPGLSCYIYAAGRACAQQAFGLCSQQCEESGTARYGYLCSCLSGYSLQRDGYTCLANGEHCHPTQYMMGVKRVGHLIYFSGVARIQPLTCQDTLRLSEHLCKVQQQLRRCEGVRCPRKCLNFNSCGSILRLF